MPSKDFKNKKLNKNQLELANVLRYLDERMLNLTEQIRSVAIAAKVSPEDFQRAFRDAKLQDDFFVKLHVAEDLYEAEERVKAQKEQAKVQIIEETANVDSVAPTSF